MVGDSNIEVLDEQYPLLGGKSIITFPNPQQISLSIRASALVFEDPESQRLLSLIEWVAPSNATAFIMGETGTGKELVARHIHALSGRRNGPFAAIGSRPAAPVPQDPPSRCGCIS